MGYVFKSFLEASKGIAAVAITMAGLFVSVYFSNTSWNGYVEPILEKRREYGALSAKVIAFSAGEDSVWSRQEQVKFLRDMHINERVIRQGESVHLIPQSKGVEVYIGTKISYEHSPQSPEYRATLDLSTLERYLKINAR